jgi:hypothetical protein
MSVVRSYYENGALRYEGVQIDGIPHGVIRLWHPNGVLDTEIPMDHGVISGIVKQWNDKGELLGTSDVTNGTGVDRRWYPDGTLQIEIPYVDGATTGRQRIYWDTGELLEVSYWLKNKKVSRKRYLEACQQDPNLPRYEDQPAPRKRRERATRAPKSPSPAERELIATDQLPIKLLQKPGAREALSWLEETREPPRSLGEATSQDDSIRLVKKLYRLGATGVHAVEINGEPDEEQNTGRLVIELPHDQERRKKILTFTGKLAHELGFDPEPDVGQRYTFLMLD